MFRIEGADHVDLYDKKVDLYDKKEEYVASAVGKLAGFFTDGLKAPRAQAA